MSRAPLRIKVHPHESFGSVVSCYAVLNGAPDAATFASWFGANFKAACGGLRSEVDKLAVGIPLAPHDLMARIVTGRQTTRSVLGHTFPREFISRHSHRICMHCMADDRENNPGQENLRPYERLTWGFKYHRVCTKHSLALVETQPIHWELGDDFYYRLQKTMAHITERGLHTPPATIDRFIVAAFEGADTGIKTWLLKLPLEVALRLADAIGHSIDLGRGPHEVGAWADHGLQRIAGSPAALRRELRRIVRDNYPRRTMTLKSVFGNLAHDLGKDLHRPDFAPIAEMMREVAREMLPLGPDDDVLGSVPIRLFHTVRTAAREYQIPASLLRQVIPEQNLERERKSVPLLHPASSIAALVEALPASSTQVQDGRQRFLAMMERERAARAEIGNALATVPVSKAARELKTTTNVIWSLSDDGYLPILTPPKHAGVGLVPRVDLAQFKHRYISSVEFRTLLRQRRKMACAKVDTDFTPRISRSQVGEDFYDRNEFIHSF